MKLSNQENLDDCVAYIDRSGSLRIRDTGRTGARRRGAVILHQNGELKNGYLWEPKDATWRFYPGDRVSITF